MSKEEKLTPAMQQYYDMKAQYKECILFFRMGDFYEMFDEDALTVGRELGLTVTSRNKNAETPTPLAGIPYHAGDKYLAELTKKGYKVAIAEQVSDPKLPGIVQRKIVRVVTPATTLQEEVLGRDASNFLTALVESQNTFTLAYVDLSTGAAQLKVIDGLIELKSELFRIQPRELLLSEHLFSSEETKQILRELQIENYYFYKLKNSSEEILEHQYGKHALSSMGIEKSLELKEAAAMAISYLLDTQMSSMEHLRAFKIVQNTSTMGLDEGTIRNLELLFTQREGKSEGSLFYLLHQTKTGSGSRLLRTWLLNPLLDQSYIEIRQQFVEECMENSPLRKAIRTHLGNMYDVERLLAKLSLERANARDVISLKITLQEVLALLDLLNNTGAPHISTLFHQLPVKEIQNLVELIEKAIIEEPPLTIQEGGIIKTGFRKDIDELKALKQNATNWLLQYQESEQEKTGIQNLKIKFNNVFGYFIELTKSQSSKAPEYYIRRQTMVNAERYTTPELKTYEDKILGADQELSTLEYSCFQELRLQILTSLHILQELSEKISELDIYACFAEIAFTYHYTKPLFHSSEDCIIRGGRHPVIEALEITQGRSFIPNSVTFIEKQEELLLITGPNMAGKSTYLRQTALICLMAQIGCYVPAEEAKLPIVDQIFTRVGASDNVSKGQSTFMVEMQETAFILNNASKQSLIILDEVGRGTSTYDGLSLAWAIIEYIHEHIGAKTLFATHYHELIEVADTLKRAKNYSVAVQETSTGVVFLRKIVKGGASESYGIEVAKLAGLPVPVIRRAGIIMSDLEKKERHAHKKKPDPNQLSFFTFSDQCPAPIPLQIPPIVQELQKLDLNSMSPIEALNWISKKQKELS